MSLPVDPWAHRSESMRCRTCMWFVPKWPENFEIQGETIQATDYGDVGRCRRHAPTITGYPVVFHTDWCGDHKLSEQVRAHDLSQQSQKPLRKQ